MSMKYECNHSFETIQPYKGEILIPAGSKWRIDLSNGYNSVLLKQVNGEAVISLSNNSFFKHFIKKGET